MFKYCRMTEGKRDDIHTTRNDKAVNRSRHDMKTWGLGQIKVRRMLGSSQFHMTACRRVNRCCHRTMGILCNSHDTSTVTSENHLFLRALKNESATRVAGYKEDISSQSLAYSSGRKHYFKNQKVRG